MRTKFKEGVEVALSLLFISFILLAAAFFNRYPITHFGDTAVYLTYGFTKTHVGGTHSFLYGLYLYFSSFQFTLWGPVLFQALILAFLIVEVLFNFSNYNYKLSCFTGFIIVSVLSFTTSLSKHVSSIMPDIFTSICYLSFILLLLGNKINKTKRIILSLILMLAITFHTSHVVTMVGFCILLFITYLIWIKKNHVIHISKIINICVVIVLAVLTIIAVHKKYMGKYYFSKSGSTILLGRLVESGILDDYLNNYCSVEENSLCEFKGTFMNGWSFHWDANTSPIYKNKKDVSFMGCWDLVSEEYNIITKKIFQKPKYIIWFLMEAVKGTIGQLQCYTYLADNQKIDWIEQTIAFHLPNDKFLYFNSNQVKSTYLKDFDEPILSRMHLLYFVSSMFILTLLFINSKIKTLTKTHLLILVSFVLFILSNAVVSSSFSGVYPRYQDRVVWLFPFISILVILQLINPYLTKFLKRLIPKD